MTTDLGFAARCQIGASQATLTDVKTEPWSSFENSRRRESGIAPSVKGLGHAFAVWDYSEIPLSHSQYYQLKNLIGDNSSVTVFIRTPTNTPTPGSTYAVTLATYEAVMTIAEDFQLGAMDLWTGGKLDFLCLSSY